MRKCKVYYAAIGEGIGDFKSIIEVGEDCYSALWMEEHIVFPVISSKILNVLYLLSNVCWVLFGFVLVYLLEYDDVSFKGEKLTQDLSFLFRVCKSINVPGDYSH